MDSRTNNRNDRERGLDLESSATREAANSALAQLELIVDCLQVRQPHIARGLERNRKQAVDDVR
jgi:hypothetical protein